MRHAGADYRNSDSSKRHFRNGFLFTDYGGGNVRTKRKMRYTSEIKLWGCPLLSIAFGPDTASSRRCGVARGIIAIGDIAVGVIAIGGLSFGLISIGGVAVGGLVLGGVALGGLAFGGVAIGLAAAGGVAVGVYAAGGKAVGTYILNSTQRDPQAVDFFGHFFTWIAPKT